jgi:type I restriction enzyme R subunit
LHSPGNDGLASTPEQQAREGIDRLLIAAGWRVFDIAQANIHAARGVAIREFPLPGYGFADYLLYLDGKATGVIEAKKEGVTLTGVETQAEKYTKGLPAGLPRWGSPLPFSYQSTGVETRFTNGLDPQPRSRPVFAFHKPELLAEWLTYGNVVDIESGKAAQPSATFLAKLQAMPPLKEDGLWPAQIKAIQNLEQSLKANRPRALIQMATGSGKTFTAISFIYRLIKFAGARRVLFLVDRGNLGDQTLKEFQLYDSPYNNFKFTQEYIVQRLQGNTLDTTARVCICTIQRMYSMLKGKDLPEELEEESVDQLGGLFKQPEPIEYNPAIPIESFDIIVTDECHRSIYNLWAQVLEYFDAYLIGLTATPSKQTFGFFHQNLVMECNHEMAVADGVNVNYDVYRIRTAITEQGSQVEAGYSVQIQERDTRKKRWEQLDDDFSYDPNQLDRDVVAPDQIRKIIQTYRDKLFTEIFPGREWVPKTLIFAKDDAHAENIVEIVREEFGKGNDFAQKITYRSTGAKPKDLINELRTSPMPRIAVTVDMIAMIQSFEQFIAEHKDEITALQVLYSQPYKHRLTFEAVKELADAIEKPPYLWNESQLWNAYAALEKSKVKGATGRRILTDLVSLVRFAIHQDNELIPFPERVNANFKAWLVRQESSGKPFTGEQRRWLEMIRDHIAANLGIEPDDFNYAPFVQAGGLGKVHLLFGDQLDRLVSELNLVLVA